MFDADAVRLIGEAPPLDGLDLAELPQEFTNAYASIVSARIRLRDLSSDGVLPEELAQLVSKMKRLAYTQEALVSAVSDRANRTAAAFVAGSAHHVVLMAERLVSGVMRPSRLGYHSVSPEVSAALLFLVAEASTDASEMANGIRVHSENPIEAGLLKCISHLAHGRLREILAVPVAGPEVVLTTDREDPATQALYGHLQHGVRSFALILLGESRAGDTARQHFEAVKQLGVSPLEGIAGINGAPLSAYPGPVHLASLLSAATGDLVASAVVNLLPPSGVDGDGWRSHMRRTATVRPYLWRNHISAIKSGYLEPGVSAVISFPTGAGKSTLSELKIAVSLLRGNKVVFLAPTLALVDQTARALSNGFPDRTVHRERDDSLPFEFEDEESLPDVSVMTPERCLAMLSFDPKIFSSVGLVVFDECHLLHPRENDQSRRAINAMLCLLNLVAICAAADFLLLSAMMSNSEEIARWIESLTGRKCLPLALTWKPTRQVRGCVVYSESEISKINDTIAQARQEFKTKNAPASLMRSLVAKPFGFFCLHQTWQSTARKDYALLPLLEKNVTLSTGTTQRKNNWYLTPNGNKVAARLAAASAGKRLKTLVFTQTITLANSAASMVSGEIGRPEIALSDQERAWYVTSVDEMGGPDHVYLQVDAEGALLSSCAPHHGLLLAAERHLHESLFRRSDGISVLVATSTLAQGMNLPSEVVIIGNDSRFDPTANRVEQLEAHELLNAAGRAGRAGQSSQGFVLVVPSKVVYFDNAKSRIHNHWTELQAIFAQSDQCLVIDDPLRALLDEVHDVTGSQTDAAKYLLLRLPVGAASVEDADSDAKTLLRRSLAAFRAKEKGDSNWIETRIDAVLKARQAERVSPTSLTWQERLSATTGVDLEVINELGKWLDAPFNPDAPIKAWANSVSAWLTHYARFVPRLIRKEGVEGLFGKTYKELSDDESRGKYAAPRLMTLLDSWMTGGTLKDIEVLFGTKPNRLGKCESAREFVLRLLPELAYIYSLPAQIVRALREQKADETEVPVSLTILGACVKEGFDHVDKYALRQYRHGNVARRAVHREYAAIEPFLGETGSDEQFADVMRRVEGAVMLAEFLA